VGKCCEVIFGKVFFFERKEAKNLYSCAFVSWDGLAGSGAKLDRKTFLSLFLEKHSLLFLALAHC
jgi:hypothetical protein